MQNGKAWSGKRGVLKDLEKSVRRMHTTARW